MSSPVCQTCLIDLYRKMTDQFRRELFDDSGLWMNQRQTHYPHWVCYKITGKQDLPNRYPNIMNSLFVLKSNFKQKFQIKKKCYSGKFFVLAKCIYTFLYLFQATTWISKVICCGLVQCSVSGDKRWLFVLLILVELLIITV